VPTVDRVPYRPSEPLRAWCGPRRALLDALAAGASSEPLVEAYAVRVVAEFQGFARDLHGEGTNRALRLAAVPQRHLRSLVRATTAERRLDAANPSIDALARDFARLGLDDLADALSRAVPGWPAARHDLGLLLALRNAVAHGDDLGRDKAVSRGASVTVAWIGSARTRLDAVAAALDHLTWTALRDQYRKEPW
jgi:uncharacterized protein (DUF433 family)